MMRAFLTSVAAVALLACAEETPPPVAPPSGPVVAAPAVAPPVAPTATAAIAPAPALLAPPVMAKLVDVTAAGVKLPVASSCDVLFVSVAKGSVVVGGQSLAQGDTLMTSGGAAGAGLELKGAGLVVSVTAPHDCPASSAPPAPATRLVRAGDTKDTAWAGGTMHAHLDFEKEASPDVYVGRFEGTGAVAEHDHGPSWEVLCAIEGSGTFTIDGVPRRIVGPAIVAVPPGRRHSWQPDAGVKLVAVQVYAPPGPEQRFKALSQH
jgi:mannose-6-phosphate isomerase-like protein (cupin superfamily)